MLNELS